MEKSLQGGCVMADVIASGRWKNHKVNYFNFSSEVLNRIFLLMGKNGVKNGGLSKSQMFYRKMSQ